MLCNVIRFERCHNIPHCTHSEHSPIHNNQSHRNFDTLHKTPAYIGLTREFGSNLGLRHPTCNWKVPILRHSITQWRGPSEYNSGMLGVQSDSESPSIPLLYCGRPEDESWTLSNDMGLSHGLGHQFVACPVHFQSCKTAMNLNMNRS
jgi:hypothetical protein